MKSENLQTGDIIFFVNNYSNYDPEREDYVDHIAVVTGFNKKNEVLITHSVQQEQAAADKPSGLCTTTLRKLTKCSDTYVDPHTNESITSYYDVDYQVARLKNKEIAQKAAQLLSRWAQYRIPYDENRLQAKIDLEDNEGYEYSDFVKASSEKYQSEGIFRAIKFASRRGRMLTQPGIDCYGKGLTCSMSVALAFQVAELVVEGLVKENSEDWSSDKYADLVAYEGDIREKFGDETFNAYQQYVQLLRAQSKVVVNQENCQYIPSVLFWNPSEQYPTPLDFTSQILPLDCKVLGAGGIYQYTKDAENEWEHIADHVEIKDRTFSPQDRAEYKAKMVRAHHEALNRLAEERNHHSSPRATPSPASTPSPLSSQGLFRPVPHETVSKKLEFGEINTPVLVTGSNANSSNVFPAQVRSETPMLLNLHRQLQKESDSAILDEESLELELHF